MSTANVTLKVSSLSSSLLVLVLVLVLLLVSGLSLPLRLMIIKIFSSGNMKEVMS